MKKPFQITTIFFQILLFLYIYSPPFKVVPLGIIKIISLGSVAGLFFLFYKTTTKVISYRFLLLHLGVFLSAIAYAYAQDFVLNPSGLSLGETNFYQQLLIFLELLPIALFLSIFCRKKLKFDHFDLVSALANIGIAQSFFCLAMLVVPSLRIFILGSLLEYEEIEERFLSAGFYGNYRGFGIGIGYEFSLSVFQGFVLAFICLLCFHNFKRYGRLLFFTPLVVLSIVLNARIGLWVFGGFLIVAAIAYLRKISVAATIKNGLYVGFVVFALILGISFLGDTSTIAKNIEWVGKSYTQSIEYLTGEGQKGTLYILADRHIHFPKTIEGFFFGEGRYVFGEIAKKSGYDRSDIGYIRNIYFGGFIYLALLFSSLAILFWSGLKLQKNYLLKVLMYFLFVACVVAHIKGNIFSSNPGYRAAYLIFIFNIVNRYIDRQEQQKLQQVSWLQKTRQLAPKFYPYK